MKRIFMLAALGMAISTSFAQVIEVTFSGSGESTVVDSVIATNLTTSESLTLPGHETLTLSGSTGITEIPFLREINVFPNPSNGKTSLVFTQPINSEANIRITNLTGQLVLSTIETLKAGTHSFTISFAASGVYLIQVDGVIHVSTKVMCITPASKTSILNTGTAESPYRNQKAQLSTNSLSYTPGDWIHYKGTSEKYTTIVTDSVQISKNIEFEFVDCTDPDGRTYQTVKIGEQFWMGENLAYVPNINPATWSSKNSPYTYVNGYEDTIISAAISLPNYLIYGALYNYASASSYCPEGWHLPSREEWLSLIDFLDESPVFKLKETGSTHWVENEKATNTSGFSARPSGFKKGYWEGPWSTTYISPGFEAFFWTATAEDSDSINETTAWNISLSAYKNDYDMKLYDKSGHTIHYYACTTLNNGYSVRCIKDE